MIYVGTRTLKGVSYILYRNIYNVDYRENRAVEINFTFKKHSKKREYEINAEQRVMYVGRKEIVE